MTPLVLILFHSIVGFKAGSAWVNATLWYCVGGEVKQENLVLSVLSAELITSYFT